MNWKQLVCMWCGIAAICGLGWLGLYIEHFAYMGYKGFFFRAYFVRGKHKCNTRYENLKGKTGGRIKIFRSYQTARQT